MTKVLRFKETDRGPASKIDLGDDRRERGIRCPKCAWRPRAHDRWECMCSHTWNTFDTRGVCPACHFRWAQTQCLRCHAMSPHEAWYVDEPHN